MENLINKLISLKSGSSHLKETSTNSFREEYSQFQKTEKENDQKKQEDIAKLCDKLKAASSGSINKDFILSSEHILDDKALLSCSLNDLFAIQASFLNSKNNFP